jgi:hypothetical protein
LQLETVLRQAIQLIKERKAQMVNVLGTVVIK